MSTQTITTPYGSAALEVLTDVVSQAKAHDPMAPVTLLVPNNLAGIIARRHLARGLAGRDNGVAGLALATTRRLAEQLAAPLLAPRRPATGPVVAAAWRSALRAAPGVFDAVRDHPATVRALVSAHSELRDLDAEALEAVSRCSTLTHDLVRLLREVTSMLGVDWYDEITLLAAAADLVTAQPRLTADRGHVVIYLPQELTRAEGGFVTALAGCSDSTLVLGLTDVERGDRVVRRSVDRLGLTLSADKGRARVATEVVHASDSDDEVRCVVRDVVATLQQTPAHRVAVLYGSTAPYARLLHEHLDAAGLLVNGPGTRPVIERAVGRGFLDILLLAAADVPRAALFTAVSEAPTRAFDGTRVPASRWERLSRTAAVVAGDDWSTRLDGHVASLESDLDRERQGPEPFQSRIDGYERDLASARALRDFAVSLRDRLRHGATLRTWSDLGAWAVTLFRDLYGDAQAMAQLPPEEQYAAVTVESTLRGLGDLDPFEPVADLDGLVDVLTLALESALPRVGRFGEGILVAPISAAIGLDADVVYVLGLAEDSYPGRLGEDALLLEHVRDASHGQLASSRDRLDAKHRHLLAAFDAAPRVVASLPRGDLRRSTGRLPSRWLLPTLRDLASDHSLAATGWDRVTSARLQGSASYASSLMSLTLPASEQEWRAGAAAAHRDLADRVVDQAVELIQARASSAFTRFDGNLADVDGLPDFSDGVHAVAPTTLEGFAVCPHAFFVGRLLRVEQVEQPEEIISISPLDIGSLMHETMDAFVRECLDAPPGYGEPWTDSQRERLRAIALEQAARFESRGATGHARLWETERDRVLADLGSMLDSDDARRHARDSRVVRSELAFGRDGTPPVGVEVHGGRVLMRGSADLVHEARDGTLIVIDIKTGGMSRFGSMKTDPIAAGTKLQLPVYAAAARQLLGGDRAEAAYWFVRQGKRGWIEVELTDDLQKVYAQAVGTLVTSISAGQFPAKAPEGPDFAWVQCTYCNPDGLGHGDVRTRWERKRHDETLHDLVVLVDPGALPDHGSGVEMGR